MASSSQPDLTDGIDYWSSQPASLDGVLGGFGTGSLPRVDALGSRLFLLHLFPELSTVDSALKPIGKPHLSHRIRALDVGAGIGRVTADVLLFLVSDVLLLEPVTPFVQEALARARHAAATPQRNWLRASRSTYECYRVGYSPEKPLEDVDSGFDVIWCQWCLGHLNDAQLVEFFRRSHAALRKKDKGKSLIVVKENVCSDAADGGPKSSFDDQDSSLTRSDSAWKAVFTQAGLRLVREQVQEGLPEGLYTVKMYALR
ncbi:alpha-N-methyltransferase NTM1 [Armillaria borealis]|uniref:Alpha N-terminal protein methyltransferase 1 n=1 Tax=Armillaria borealis TaxID=47425 RepID=A0AA39JXV7_9AGAR|nr:alpha-N-methyltransferase NTM1 [Armillaria borealis]